LWLGCNYKIYPIFFVLHFHLVNYIRRCIWNIKNTQTKLKRKCYLIWTNKKTFVTKKWRDTRETQNNHGSQQPLSSFACSDWSSTMAPYSQNTTGQTTFPCFQAWIHNLATGAILWAFSHLAHTDSTQTSRKSSASILWLRFQRNNSDSTNTVLLPKSLSAVLFILTF